MTQSGDTKLQELFDAAWESLGEGYDLWAGVRRASLKAAAAKFGLSVPDESPTDLTDEELRALADFFNDDNYSMPNDLYDQIGKKLLVLAVKAGLYG
jgi:hypothetical protein